MTLDESFPKSLRPLKSLRVFLISPPSVCVKKRYCSRLAVLLPSKQILIECLTNKFLPNASMPDNILCSARSNLVTAIPFYLIRYLNRTEIKAATIQRVVWAEGLPLSNNYFPNNICPKKTAT